MPTFATPQPISATIELLVGEIRIAASERTDTVVQVRPRDETNDNDVKAAAQARVDYSDGKLTVKAAKPLQIYLIGRVGTIDVSVELPTGSHVRGRTPVGDVRCTGRVGDCNLKTSVGDVSVEQAAAVTLSTTGGEVIADRVNGDAHVTGAGIIRIGEITGKAAVKNLNGDCWIGEIAGDATVTSANGNIQVDRAGSSLTAKTANGRATVGEVRRGEVVLKSGTGQLEVGIREGSAAWLDVKSGMGRVRNTLEPTDGPGTGEAVKIRAHTHLGDIVIRRSSHDERKNP